jgi:hypothetical protein
MKRIAIAFALALSPLAAAGACASFEQVAAKPARSIIADAETAWVGTAEVVGLLYSNGVITQAQLRECIDVLTKASAALDTAHALLKAGEDVAAAASVADMVASLSDLNYQLALLRDAFKSTPKPEPTPAHFQPVKV